MISDRWKQIEEIFNSAIELPAQDRSNFLQTVCANDLELRNEVESLLKQDDGTGSILKTLISKAADSLLNKNEEPDLVGKQIGPYQITGLIGRGGMAEVYRAVRADDQYKKIVAIKLIHQNPAASFLISRFRYERQILASLEHPSIARFLEGGTTEDGMPYLVMEFIQGELITNYCVQHNLSVRERLQLFKFVCDAVQYAHRNLVIHRDLKPSNILVTSEGVPKLLDFGIAKLLNPELIDDAPTATIASIRLMTPEYASPEQVRGEQVTTATDVYSLGAVLYELLTNVCPHQFKTKAITEIEHVVCEVEPELPSSAVFRGTTVKRLELKKLSHELAREVDNIVLMAMRKDPHQRYETVQQFTEDIDRYLNGLPVRARTQTLGYRAIKFARRHKTAVAVVTLLIAMLAGIAVLMTVQTSRIAKERDRANKVTEFLVNLFEVSNPSEAKGNSIKARELLDVSANKIGNELNDQPEVQAALMDTIGRVYSNLGLYKTSASLLEQALRIRTQILGEKHIDVASTLDHLAAVYQEMGKYEEAESLARKSFAMRKEILGNEHPDVAEVAGTLGQVLQNEGKFEDAETFFRMALAIQRKNFGEENEQVTNSLNDLAIFLKIKGDIKEAESLYRKTLVLRRKLLGNFHPSVASTLNNLGRLLTENGQLDEAEKLLREATEIDLKVFGKDHPERAISMNNLAFVYREKKEYEKAEMIYREALEIRRKSLGENHPSVARNIYSLGLTLIEKGDYDQAEPLLLEAQGLWKKNLPPEHPDQGSIALALAKVRMYRGDSNGAKQLLEYALMIRIKNYPPDHTAIANVKSALGECLASQGFYAEAETLLLDAYRVWSQKQGKNHADTIKTGNRLVVLYDAWGKPAEADRYRSQ
jgi:serine/threonine-protein kinase